MWPAWAVDKSGIHSIRRLANSIRIPSKQLRYCVLFASDLNVITVKLVCAVGKSVTKFCPIRHDEVLRLSFTANSKLASTLSLKVHF